MYYVCLILAIVSAFFAARFCVSIAAGIDRRWLRRSVFWLAVLPGVLTICLSMIITVGDDMILLRLPRLFIGTLLPTAVFAVTFLIAAFRGFRVDSDSQTRHANKWKDGRRLIAVVTILGVSLFAYDWQLKKELLHLKSSTLADWRQTPQATISDDQNAAVEFLSLGEFQEVLNNWHTKSQARFGDNGFEGINSDLFFSTIPNSAGIEDDYGFTPETLDLETDFTDEWFAGFRVCEAAFQRVRDAAVKPQLAIVRHLEHPTDEQFATEFSLLLKTLDLFKINLLAEAAAGNLKAAYSDLAVLLATAKLFDTDITSEGRRCGGFARTLAGSAAQHLLYLDPAPPTELLEPLINEKHNPRCRLPELMKWETVLTVIRKCDAHLNLLDEDELDSMWDLEIMNRFPSFLSSRLAMAGDELPRLENRRRIYTRIAERWKDTSVTGKTLLLEFSNQWPPEGWTGSDNRDLRFHAANARYDMQQSMNLMIAATLFQIQTGEFPTSVSELVPGILSTVPFSLRDGKEFTLHQFRQGIIICGPADTDTAEQVTSNPNSIRFSDSFFHGSAFLGAAYRLAYIREPDTANGSGSPQG